jgi:hypothetical protein
MDFVHDALFDGRPFRVLTVVERRLQDGVAPRPPVETCSPPPANHKQRTRVSSQAFVLDAIFHRGSGKC